MRKGETMIANYHTHTSRCNHAVGKDREYAEAALQRGLKLLGFSDHTPYPFPVGYESWFRMKRSELEGYVLSCRLLQEEYRGKLDIHIGLEAEFYPAYHRDLMALLRDSGVEYLLLGQHYLDNEIGAHYSGEATADPDLLKRYCHQVMDAMQTGHFTYLAHPDLLNFTGDRKLYQEQMARLCREAKACGVPLEVNLLGIEKVRHYPDRQFWELAAVENCEVILGCDTHDPAKLSRTESEEAARSMIAELGLRCLERVEPLKIY